MSVDLLDAVRRSAVRFEIHEEGFRALLDAIGDARLVLIGEASHGTQEFYDARAAVTRALIRRKGFNLVAVEADWPDAYRVNRWVRGFDARLAAQFDAVMHIDDTRALEPLEQMSPHEADSPETYPSAL